MSNTTKLMGSGNQPSAAVLSIKVAVEGATAD